MTTNQEWLFSLTLEEYLEWMESEHYEPNPDCSAMLYETFTGNMCSHYEPKDGVVAILREAARNLSDYHDAGEALRRLTGTWNVYHALETLADMVERDYVRRESIEEVMDNDRALVEENSMLAGELLKLKVELEKATNNLNSANEDFENARAELVAERDELKGQVFTLKSECDDLENELYELTADLDAAKQQISQFDAPKSVETSENLASKCEISDFDDSREQLEADVLNFAEKSGWLYPMAGTRIVLEWLDRQAAITEEQTRCKWVTASADEIAAWGSKAEKLKAKVDELKAERDELQEQLRIGWECECRLQAERERYREKFGKCLDYADAIHALMDDEGMA